MLERSVAPVVVRPSPRVLLVLTHTGGFEPAADQRFIILFIFLFTQNHPPDVIVNNLPVVLINHSKCLYE